MYFQAKRTVAVLLPLLFSLACGSNPTEFASEGKPESVSESERKRPETATVVRPYGLYRRQNRVAFEEVVQGMAADGRAILALTKSAEVRFRSESDLLFFFRHKALTETPDNVYAFELAMHDATESVSDKLYLNVLELEKLLRDRCFAGQIFAYNHELQADVASGKPSKKSLELLAGLNQVLGGRQEITLSDLNKGFIVDNIRDWGPVRPTIRPESLRADD